MSGTPDAGHPPPFPAASGVFSWRGVPLSDLTYTVVDLETTGLQADTEGITEVCCLRVSGGQIVDSFETLVNPRRPIPYFIQKMTGISDEMVRDAPGFGEIASRLLEFLDGTVLVAHNAPFDLSFLNHNLATNGHCRLHNPVIDTRRLARRLLPGLQRANLDAVTTHLGIAIQNRHRARGDAEATALALVRLLAICGDQGIENDAQLEALLSTRREARDDRETGALVASGRRYWLFSPSDAGRCRRRLVST